MEPMINATDQEHAPARHDQIMVQMQHHESMVEVNRVLVRTPDLFHEGTMLDCPGKSCDQTRQYWIIRRTVRQHHLGKGTEPRAEPTVDTSAGIP